MEREEEEVRMDPLERPEDVPDVPGRCWLVEMLFGPLQVELTQLIQHAQLMLFFHQTRTYSSGHKLEQPGHGRFVCLW